MPPTTDSDSAPSLDQVQEIVQAHHFLFICGLHRSGTTLLFRMLREHPLVSGFENNKEATEWLALDDEGQYLQTVYPPGVVFGGPGKFAFAPEAHLTEDSELLTPENKARLAREWFPFWDLNKRYLLEKSPPNLIMTRFLQSAFPNSSFVILERHPVAVSLATEKWSPTGMDSLIEHWLAAHETFETDRPYLGHVMTVKYETMISEPTVTLRNIYAFLGAEAHGTMFQPTTEHNQKYFAQWRELEKNPETSSLIEECIAKHEKRVAAFGYSLKDLEKH
jgi:Sulfotransferase family